MSAPSAKQHRERVSGGGGVGHVAADGAAVLDLGRTDGRGSLLERRHELGDQRRSAQLGVRRERADDERVALDRDAPQLVQAPDVEDALGRLADLTGHLDHEVGAAGQRPPRGARGIRQQRVRGFQASRGLGRRLDGIRHRSTPADPG